jgi:hypothetical protein
MCGKVFVSRCNLSWARARGQENGGQEDRSTPSVSFSWPQKGTKRHKENVHRLDFPVPNFPVYGMLKMN